MRVSFDDALRGVTLKVPVVKANACSACHGSGAAPGTSPTICPDCKGRGVTAENQGFFALSHTCRRCGGAGTIIETPCGVCGGSGRVRSTKTYQVRIPAGVRDGTRIKVRGKGEAAPRGGEPGDLYVITQVDESKVYSRRGDDLLVEVPVTFAEAAMGADVELPTPDGDARPRQGAGRLDRRQDAAGQGPRRAQAEGLGHRRPAGQAADRRALEDLQAGARDAGAAGRAAALGARRPARGAVQRRWVVNDGPRYTISVAAELTGMHPQTLRMYEQRGLLSPRRTPGGTRRYSDADLERLRRIASLTTEAGMNLVGAVHVLALEQTVARSSSRSPAFRPSSPRRPSGLATSSPTCTAATAAI